MMLNVPADVKWRVIRSSILTPQRANVSVTILLKCKIVSQILVVLKKNGMKSLACADVLKSTKLVQWVEFMILSVRAAVLKRPKVKYIKSLHCNDNCLIMRERSDDVCTCVGIYFKTT